MIISHKYRFIFIKTKKTAGTSIEIALSKFCDGDDIITPISPEDEKIRQMIGYRGPQNYYGPLSSYTYKDFGRLLLKFRRKILFYNHITANDIRKLLPQDIWQNYYKFCFERNPWDKVISWYYWKNKSEERPPITEFLRQNSHRLRKELGGFNYYSCNGDLIVDKVFLYENIGDEMKYLAKKLSFPEMPLLPKAKSRFRRQRDHYRTLLSEFDKSLIEDIFSEEISMFDYKY